MGITLTSLTGGMIGFAIGIAVSSEFKLALDHIRNAVRLKLLPRHEEIINTLSRDTQIILRQYMEQVDYYGQTVYAVRDVKAFDKLLRNHCFNNFDSGVENIGHEIYKCRDCDLNKCIYDNLANGNGFVIWMNGEQYVAMVPPVNVDPVQV